MAEAIPNQSVALEGQVNENVGSNAGVTATNNNASAVANTASSPDASTGVVESAQIADVPKNLGYTNQDANKLSINTRSAELNNRVNQLEQSGDIAGAMNAARERNEYMAANGLAYDAKNASNAPQNVPNNAGGVGQPGGNQNAPGGNTTPNSQIDVPKSTGMNLPMDGSAASANLAQEEASKATSDALMGIANKLDAFTEKSVSAYQSVLDQFKSFSESAMGNITTNMNSIIATLEKREALYQQEKETSMAREEARLDRMLTVAEQKKENALKQNDLAKTQTDAIWEQRQNIAEDNNARYLGYLNAKMSVNGFVKGSAGLLSIGKYMAASEMALNEISRERSNAIATYSAKGQEIMDTYFDNVYQLEYDSATKISEIQFKMNDAIMDVSMQKTQTEMQKNTQVLEIAKEYNAMQLDIQTKKDNLILQSTQQKMQELQIAHQVTMDYMNQTRSDKTLDWQIETDERNFDRGVTEFDKTFDFQKDVQAFNEDIAVKQFNEDVKQFGLTYALQNLQFGETKRQFNETMSFEKDQAALKTSLEDKTWRMSMVEKGLMNADSLKQYFNPEDVIMSSSYVGKDGTVENLGERVAKAFEAAGTGVKTLANQYQCVQFVRDIVGDLPTGLMTLADKVRILTQGKGSIDAPQPGATVVLDWGQGTDPNTKPGHVAYVTNVSADKKTFDIVQFNAPKPGEKSTKTIRTDDPTIKGYWLSPSIQKNGPANANSKVISGISADDQTRVDAVVRKAGSNDQAKSDLQSLREYAAKGDQAGFNSYLRNAAVANLTTSEKDKYGVWSDIVGDSNRFLETLPNFDTASGPYKKMFESTKPWVGLDKDPEFQSIAGLAGLTTQAYKLMNVGQNLTATEAEAISEFIPRSTDTFKELYTKMENLRRFGDVNANRIVDRAMGLDGSKTSSKYDSIRVRLKDSGDEVYVDRDTYDAYKDQMDLLN